MILCQMHGNCDWRQHGRQWVESPFTTGLRAIMEMTETRSARKPGKLKPGKPKDPPRLRSFIGIRFSLSDRIKLLSDELQLLAGDSKNKLRISPPENRHITLKFLGSIPQAQLAEVSALTAQVAAKHPAMQLSCRGIGFFRHSIWVGIDKNDALTALATALDQAFPLPGISPEQAEQKIYVPHITVARFAPDARIKLSSLTEKFKAMEWGAMDVRKIHFYRSETLPEGARYTILDSYPLTSEKV